MNKEKIVLSFVATLIGLLVAGGIFYFYQSAKTIPQSKIRTISFSTSPTPAAQSSIFLIINTPSDEKVVDKKIITLSGKTVSDAAIVILTQGSQDVIAPSSTGDFSTTITLDNGENLIEITAILPNGEKTKVTRTVTYSTEEF